ncbi:DeoR family transcriptional regulator [Acidovorax sp. GBBC 3332]|nr:MULTISPECIES: DeoR family transcriptional regulator [unclassified Acidovorax]MDA8449815.1 DeoR family transcriptional regulator [Acidovorax sp. GBBC 3297]MDA8459260.1 DeoR family transcriptional regulator [Acidovorax sp. GBBC 3333]MDA8464297.1 DeoR family transcriptional regulator [Acidovorax sp. GBBC 3332]MDA8469493.1 DeoR family transcriptional regulator [Acidovorax sp. GBBC 3299]
MSQVAAHQHQSARRALRLLWLLQGHAFDGLRLKQAAEALQVSSPTALRDLQLLADEGVAERIPGNEECWRLTPKLIQLARAHDDEMRRMRARVDDIDQRYTRTV